MDDHLATPWVAGPCSVCGVYVEDQMHFVGVVMFCKVCCPRCGEKTITEAKRCEHEN